MKHVHITPTEQQLLPITNIGEYRGQYCIFLYWEKRYYFTSKRKADRFVAITNQFLTKVLYKARIIYMDILLKYHRDWGYFEHNKETMGFRLYDMDRKCRAYIDAIQDAFDKIVEKSHWENGSCIAFSKMFNIVEQMKDTADILHILNSSRNATFDLYQLDKISDDVLVLEKMIKRFGDTEARNLTKNNIHEPMLPDSFLINEEKLEVVA